MNSNNQKLLGSLAGVVSILLIGYYGVNFYQSILNIRKLQREEAEWAKKQNKK